MLFYLVVSEIKFSLNCLTFTGTLNQLHFSLLLVLYLIVFMEYACLLACLLTQVAIITNSCGV
jgi:hypothetical protein